MKKLKNERQYNIVDCFLKMGNSPQRIAKEFKANLEDVVLVQQTASYSQYKNAESGTLFGDMFGNLGKM